MKSLLRDLAVASLLLVGSSLAAQVAQVRHAPSLNGTVEGSVWLMTGESVTLNGGALVKQDLLVPGSPTVQLNGKPSYAGTLDGSGSTSPSNYRVTLNGGASLRNVVRRTDPISLPAVNTPSLPTGSVAITINSQGQSVSWSTVRDLTLNGGVGQYAVPAGSYGTFTANGGSGFTLGIAGAAQPSVYNFQNLNLNGNSQFQVVGPVVVNVANGFNANGAMGASGNPAWLKLNVYSGGLTLNGGVNFYGYVLAPNGTVMINGNSLLVGGVAADYLTVNGNGTLRLQPLPTTNAPPTISLTAPADGSSYAAPASFTLSANASDSDGTVALVEFFQGTTKIGQSSASPYSFAVSALAAGTYSYFARATDNLGATTDSTTISITVTSPNQPPTVTLTAPADGTVVSAPANITLSATAADTDGSVAKVEFYQGTTLLGAVTTTPYVWTASGLPAGTYIFSAKAYDNLGAVTSSSPVTVTVLNPNIPPTVSMTSPADHSVFGAPAAFTLGATAADSDGTIAKVEFFQGTTKVGEATVAPYQVTVSNFDVGEYNFLARATDNQGSSTDSTAIVVTVEAAPTVSLADPSGGSAIAANSPITLTATASAAGGTVAKVDFFQGALLLGTASTADAGSPNTYSFVVNAGLPAGSYTLTAVATDNNGVATVSAPVAVVVDIPPTVALSAPANNASFDAPASIPLQAIAADSDGTVAKVEFFAGSTKIGEVAGAPYQLNWSGMAAGLYSLTARATDNAGLSTISAPVIVNINVPPVVSLIGPADHTVLAAATGFTLVASASDADGTISKVEFFQGSAKLGEVLVAPYQWVISSLPAGVYSFTARATDNTGSTTTSAPIGVIMNAPPSVALTAPVAGTVIATPANITLSASAADPDGSVAKVEFFSGSAKLGEATSAPYLFSWSNVSSGSYSLTAKATDNFGAATVSAAVSIVVDNPPSVTLTAPANNSTQVANTPFSLTVSANDPDGTVAKVDFYSGATLLGSVNTPASGGVYTLTVPVGLTSGTYAFTAVATDNAGLSTTSSPVSVVFDAPPTVVLSEPTSQDLIATGTPLTFTATAGDSDGSVAKVDFYRGATLVGSATTALAGFPGKYSVTLAGGLPSGGYTLTAVATDNSGYSTTSAPVSIIVRVPPTVSVTSPAAGAIVVAANGLTLNAAANGVGGTVSKVDFYNGTTLLGTVTVPTSPGNYTLQVANPPAGQYSVTAKVTDSAGLTATSSPAVVFSVNALQDFVVSAGPNQEGWLHAGFGTPASTPILNTINPNLNQAIGLDYHETSGKMMVSYNFASGSPNNFGLINADGTVTPFSSVHGLQGEVFFATAKDDGGGRSLGGFLAGELLSQTGAPGGILRVSPDGSTVQSPWVVLPGEGGVGAAFWIDRTGVWNGDLIAVMTSGGVWRVNSAGSASKIAQLGLGGDSFSVITLPNDVAKYGPWAGKVVVACDGTTVIQTVDLQGTVSSTDLGVAVEDMKVIPPGQNLFIVNYPQILLGVSYSAFNDMVGDVILATESGATLYRAHWNGTSYTATKISAGTNIYEGFAFGPPSLAGLPQVPAPVTIPLNGSILEHGAPAGPQVSISWTQVSGPAVAGLSSRTTAQTSAIISVPGTYVFKLTAVDGTLNGFSTVTVTAGLNQFPAVFAGGYSDALAPGDSVQLNGTITDDGLPNPPSKTTAQWVKVSGPGNVNFADASAATTGATFDASGIYVLQLSGSDGLDTGSDYLETRVAAPGLKFASNLVAWWPGNDRPAELVHGNHDIYLHYGAGYALGKVSDAFNFNGVSGFGEVAASSDLDLGASAAGFSVEFWMNTAKPQNTTLLSWENVTTSGMRIAQASNAGGLGFYSYLVDTSGNNHGFGLDGVLTAGAWMHMAVTYDKTTGWARIYRNGILLVEQNLGIFTPRTNLPMTVAHSQALNDYYQGALDEISFYNRPLSVAEVSAIYQAGANGKAPLDGNLPPAVNAGPDVVLASTASATTLSGTVVDDNKPFGPPAIQWTMENGPGIVTFANPTSASTTATYSVPGTYLLKLTATDGETTATSDLVEVRVGASATPPASGLVAWWSANGTPKELVHGHDVELYNGAAYTSGEVLEAFSFDGVAAHARVAASSDLDLGASAAGFSVEFWMNPAKAQDRTLLTWETNTIPGVRIAQASNGGGLGFFAYLIDTNGNNHGFGLDGVLTAGVWSHFAVTYDKTSGLGRIYRNGALLVEQNLGIFTPRTNLPLTVAHSLVLNDYYQGALDEISFYNRPLSIAEISAIYQAGANGKAPLDGNLPPVVNAGPDVVLASTASAATLTGTVVDDNKPFGPPAIQWTMENGPGIVTFANPASASTTATFSAPGTYLLKLTATDGETTPVSDLMEVRVGASAIPPASGLVAWWPANGTPKELVHSHDVELYNGATYTSGEVLEAFSFDGVAAHARVAASSDLDLGASAAGMTVEFWMNTAKPQDKTLLVWENNTILGTRIAQASNGGGLGFFAYLMDTNGANHGMGLDGVLTPGVWAHFAVTYDRTTGLGQIYRNGVLLGAQNLGIFTPRTNLPLTVAHSLVLNDYYQGGLDEISFYNRPLSAAEISAIYQSGASGKAPVAQNVPPTILFDTPAANSAITANTALVFSSVAADSDGTIARVEYFDGATKLGESTTPDSAQPTRYSFNLASGLLAGTHVLTARATDNSGAVTVSAPVSLIVVPAAPVVSLTTPNTGAILSAGTALTLQASASYTLGPIAKVEFFADNTKLGETLVADSGSPTSFTLNLPGGLAAGSHSLNARATAADGATATSANVSVTAQNGLLSVTLTTPANNSTIAAGVPITLQANATTSPGSITKVEFFDGTVKLGEQTLADAGASSSYTLVANSGFSAGAHTLTARATASNAQTATSTPVSVTATTVELAVVLTSPAGNSTFSAGTPVQLVANTIASTGTVTLVEFYDGATKLGQTVAPDTAGGSVFSFTATAGFTAGAHSLVAKATSSTGATATSAPVAINITAYSGAPVVEIDTPTEDSRISAPTKLTGIVAMPALVSWALEYRLKAADGAPPAAWTQFAGGSNLVGTPATSTTAATPGDLGTFDPTLLMNGIYEVRLRASDTSNSTQTAGPITFVVEGNMKVGAFSIAFEDLKVPLVGIPITLTRTYDSRDSRIGDFGPGWHLAIGNIRVQKNRSLGQDWWQTPQAGSGIQFYDVVPLTDKIVTIVFPDGTTHRFKAGAYVKNRPGDPDYRSFAVVVTQGKYRFYPVGDTTSKLEPLDASNQLAEDFYISGTGNQELTNDQFGFEVFNPTRFRLTTKDGTQYILDESLGLVSMSDLNGNSLSIWSDGITSTQNTPAGAVSQTVYIHRTGAGVIDYITDPAGHELDYHYDASGRLDSFANRELNLTQFRYENTTFPNYLTKIIDPRGVAALRTEFDASGRMVKQIDADGNETIFAHSLDTSTRSEKVTDRLGRTTTFYYDDRGNVTTKVDPLGAQTTYSYYPDSDWVKFETDHYGNVKSTAYDVRGNVTVQTIGASASEDPANPTTGYTTRTSYNAFSAPTSITDPDGRVQSFAYDLVTNNLLSNTVGVGGPAPSTTTYHYNSDGTLDTMTDALGDVTRNTYDYSFSNVAYPGAVKQITATVTDPTANVLRTTRTVYDAQENMLAQVVTRTIPGGGTEDVVTKYIYDSENRLIATVMPDGKVSETLYTSFGQTDSTLLWRSVADYQSGNTTLARITSYGYDNRGNQTSTTYPDGSTESSSFDLENRRQWSQDRLGRRTTFQYDDVGRLRFTFLPDATPGDLTDNPYTETVYDLTGRVIDSYDELRHRTHIVYFPDGTPNAGRRQQSVQVLSTGNLVTSYQYDGAGNARFVTDPRGNTVETVFDDHGRPTAVNYPATDENPATQSATQYDVLGRRVATVDQEGNVMRYRYDGLGRLVEVRQYLDAATAASDSNYTLTSANSSLLLTAYTYDEIGNQLSQTDARGNTTSFRYDSVGRRISRILPDSATETLQYDEWGNLWKRTDFNGYTTTFAYDTLNRLTSKTASASHPSLIYSHATARVEYDYDATGARTAARTYNTGNNLLYSETTPRDARGRVDMKLTALGGLDYTYYANGLLQDTVSSNAGGVNIHYRYDEANRLAFADDSSTGVLHTTAYTYNANGSLQTVTAANGLTHTYVYDTLNRLRTLNVSKDATVLHGYIYSLNPSGHRHIITESTGRTATYGYDGIYRLTSEAITGDPTGKNGAIGFTLDKAGNRTARNSSVPSVAVAANSYNNRDWLSGDNYDANGNTLTTSLDSGFGIPPAPDVYDFEDRLIIRHKPDGSTVNLSYDADGIRVQKTVLNAASTLVSSTGYLIDTNNLTGYAQVVEESRNNTAGTTFVTYGYGTNLISQAVLAPGATLPALSYYAYDGLGSVRGMTNANGAITDTYDYDAFGILVNRTGTTDNAYLYRGEQFDTDLGMYSLRARFYNPGTGRFWNQDSYEGSSSDPMSLHKYLYANGNPVWGRDPSGHEELVELEAVVGADATLNTVAVPAIERIAGNVLFNIYRANLIAEQATVVANYAALGLGVTGLALETVNALAHNLANNQAPIIDGPFPQQFQRGRGVELASGANLRGNVNIIDHWDPESGTGVSVRSHILKGGVKAYIDAIRADVREVSAARTSPISGTTYDARQISLEVGEVRQPALVVGIAEAEVGLAFDRQLLLALEEMEAEYQTIVRVVPVAGLK